MLSGRTTATGQWLRDAAGRGGLVGERDRALAVRRAINADDDRSGSGAPALLTAHDHDRTSRPGRETDGDRTQQQPGQAAEATAAEHQ